MRRYEVEAAPDPAALGGTALESREFIASYYDTGDRRLASSGLTLQRRLERGVSTWQLNAADDDGRFELEGTAGPAGPPDSFAPLLRAQLGDRHLQQLATLRTTRSVRLIDDVAVTVDDVQVLEGHRVRAHFGALAAEPLNGGGDIELVERVLVDAGAKRHGREAWIWRVLGRPATSRPSRKAPALTHVQARFAELHGEVLRADAGLRLRDDPEDVHDLRVATRRLRALLRTARPMFDREWTDRLRAELDFLATALGSVRDLDVLIARLEQDAAQLDEGDTIAVSALPAMLRTRRAEAFADLRTTLESDRYYALLAELEGAVHAPPVEDADFDLEHAARKAFERTARLANALPSDASDGDLHALRIRGKRARYAAELAVPIRGRKARRFVKRAKGFQDLLGDHQDAVLAERTIRQAARDLPDHASSLAAGRLLANARERRRAVRRRLRPEWKRLARAGRKAWG
jgi:CHAD domain-containing protein